jgi:predicted ATP-binding protein involved in virulence
MNKFIEFFPDDIKKCYRLADSVRGIDFIVRTMAKEDEDEYILYIYFDKTLGDENCLQETYYASERCEIRYRDLLLELSSDTNKLKRELQANELKRELQEWKEKTNESIPESDDERSTTNGTESL